MSKNKGFSDTSASRYSLALYELAEENNSVIEVEQYSLSVLELIFKNREFNSFIKDPTNKKEDQLKVLTKIFEQFKFNDLFIKFLRVFHFVRKRILIISHKVLHYSSY